jgi:hypothetical protein
MSPPPDPVCEASVLNRVQALMPEEDRIFGLFSRRAAGVALGAKVPCAWVITMPMAGLIAAPSCFPARLAMR